MVQHKNIGWHAGNWEYNKRSIGIEHEGYVSDPAWYTDSMYRASAALTRWICDPWNSEEPVTISLLIVKSLVLHIQTQVLIGIGTTICH